MKALITGSGGMLGHELCDVLSKAGHSIIGIDINETDTLHPIPYTFYSADINDPGALNAVFEKETPEIVIHAAAWTDVDGCESDPKKAYRINVDGTRNVAEAAVKIGAKLIFISTDFVFDGKKNTPYTENDECAPLSVYAKTKREGEKEVEKVLKDYLIVRTSWLFGRGGRNFVDTIISESGKRKVLKVVDDQTGSPTYTKDLAMGIKGFIEKDINSGEIFNLCNSGQCSWFEFALKIKALVPEMRDIKIEPISSVELGRPALRPAFSVMNTGKFTRYTGMSLRKWEKALEEYLLR
jgi:dTDP-4-dehydrorhamnose reductase